MHPYLYALLKETGAYPERIEPQNAVDHLLQRGYCVYGIDFNENSSWNERLLGALCELLKKLDSNKSAILVIQSGEVVHNLTPENMDRFYSFLDEKCYDYFTILICPSE